MLWDTKEDQLLSPCKGANDRGQPRVCISLLSHIFFFFPQQFHISFPLKQEPDFWSDKEFPSTCSLKVLYSHFDELLAYDELFAE